MSYAFPAPKDPSDTADYYINWRSFLGCENITSFVLTAVGVTVGSSSLDTSAKGVNFRVLGGVAGVPAVISCTVTAQSLQIFQVDIILNIEQR